MKRIAVIGSGISGLYTAFALSTSKGWPAQVTLFEAGDYFGGHTHTVDVTLPTPQGQATHGVDTGFLVFNERTYPQLIALFEQLEVPVALSDMSFSVNVPDTGLQWNGSTLNSVFAQRRNLLRPRFWRMLREVLRFNRLATALAETGEATSLRMSVGEFLSVHGFGEEFRDWYFLPMIGCIWSCPTDQMLAFPMATLIRFCHNHGLIQVEGRPRWFTVAGGAKQYVNKMLPHIQQARLNCPVERVERDAQGVTLHSSQGAERFDAVVMACHSDQSLALLAKASPMERAVLGAISYHPNVAVLHTDASVLPSERRAWAAWNYERNAQGEREQAQVCLHYLLNKLQPLPFEQPVVVSLNPVREPAAHTVLGRYEYSHPVFDARAIAAQGRVPELQGQQHTWYAGAWTRFGFHEDGLMSAQAVVRSMHQHWQALGAQATPSAVAA